MVIAADYESLDDPILKRDLDYYLREYAFDIADREGMRESPERRLRPADYAPGPALASPHWRLYSACSEAGYFNLDPIGAVRFDAGRKNILRRGTGLQFAARWEGLGAGFRFVDHTERGNGPYHRRDQLLTHAPGYVGPLQGASETYYDAVEAYINYRWRRLDVTLGRDRVSWGPGREANVLIGGAAQPFDQLRLEADFGRGVRYGWMVGSLSPYGVVGDTLYTTREGHIRLDFVPKHLVLHRLEIAVSDWGLFAVNEAVVWGERGFDPAYISPIQFYYAAQHSNGDFDNVLMSGDFKVILRDRATFYGALLIDDLRTSTLGRGDPGNKLGYLAGMRSSRLGLNGLEAGLEYARLDPFVHSHNYPVNRYSHWETPLGLAQPSNSDRLTIQGSYRPWREVELKGSYTHWRQGDRGASIDDVPAAGSPRSGAPFLSGRRTYRNVLELAGLYEFRPGWTVAGGYTFDRSSILPVRFHLAAGYRYEIQ